MLENPPPPLQSPSTDSSASAPVKRYATPNQRNRSSNRRKSADRLDRANSLGNDLENNQHAFSRSVPVTDHGDAGSSNLNENHYSGFIALDGCSHSVASRLLHDRWTAAMNSYNNLKDSSEKPVMYSGVAAAWTQLRPPHQFDFLGELGSQMHSTNSGFNP